MNLLLPTLALFTGGLVLVQGNPEPTTIELLVDQSGKPHYGPSVVVPHDTPTLQFAVKPRALRTRYKLEGLDAQWQQQSCEMYFIVRFLNQKNDQISQVSFPAIGASPGWKGSVEKSQFTPRREIVKIPEDAESISVVISSAGPATAVGVFAVSQINISSVPTGDEDPVIYLKDNRLPHTNDFIWSKSGTHPSMASRPVENGGPDNGLFVIVDDDINGHADWVTTLLSQPKLIPGGSLELRWNEAYSNSSGGPYSATYERLPSGSYHFRVEDLSITGESLKTQAVMEVKVPLPYWKNLWFWAVSAASLAILAMLYGRHLIRKRIQRHLQEVQLIADERLRIARDLHDDLGTRLSHISLLSGYAQSNNGDPDTRATFGQISSMSRELISALSETVWMLNPKNNQLEALVDFLCRLVSDLCRLSEIRCRIDAMSVTTNVSITHDFRHNVSLAVKEIVNNALRHSFATEVRMSIQLENSRLKITITDNGVGITREPNKTSLGLENIRQRMAAIRGTCTIEQPDEAGLTIILEAPFS